MEAECLRQVCRFHYRSHLRTEQNVFLSWVS